MSSDLNLWALPRIERLLPLDTDSLKQIIDYSNTLSKAAAAEHLKNLLGDSPQALDFVSSFNSRRRTAPSQTPLATHSRPASPPPISDAPKGRARQQKKRPNIHALPARQVEDHGNLSGAYIKRDEKDYMASTGSRQKTKPNTPLASASLTPQPTIVPSPASVSAGPSSLTSRVPSATGSRPSSTPISRTASPAPSSAPKAKAKITLVGGAALSGPSSALSDLDAAIRALELQTNPTLSSDDPSRRCDCMATLHPLQTAAPNCISCGHIVCLKQGLGPCVSCGTPILSASDLAATIRVLKEERGQARQAAGNAAHKRAEIASKPKAFSGRDFLASPGAMAKDSGLGLAAAAAGEREAAARAHRDRLLAFQAENAQRTTVHDEAADYSMPTVDGSGKLRGNAWASPAERAKEIKAAQAKMRELEFRNRPEWERRKVVASIDLSGKKVVRRVVEDRWEDQPPMQAEDQMDATEGMVHSNQTGKGGAFSRNPLLGKMIRPVFKGQGEAGDRPKNDGWRRVQDDLEDNEDIILDGGTRGFQTAKV